MANEDIIRGLALMMGKSNSTGNTKNNTRNANIAPNGTWLAEKGFDPDTNSFEFTIVPETFWKTTHCVKDSVDDDVVYDIMNRLADDEIDDAVFATQHDISKDLVKEFAKYGYALKFVDLTVYDGGFYWQRKGI